LLRQSERFGRPTSLVLGVLWVAAVWGMMFYLRHLAQAEATRRSAREAVVGTWAPQRGAWTVEFTSDKHFQIHHQGLAWVEGRYCFTDDSEVEIRHLKPEEHLRRADWRRDEPLRFMVKISSDGLSVTPSPSNGVWVRVGEESFPPTAEKSSALFRRLRMRG
jgi:hypothetical protein